MAENEVPTRSQQDHDLLIRLDTKMDRAANDIQAVDKKVSDVGHDLGVMADGMELKIQTAVSGKADTVRVIEIKTEIDLRIADHEKRLRFMERHVWMALGVVAVGEFAIGALIAFYR